MSMFDGGYTLVPSEETAPARRRFLRRAAGVGAAMVGAIAVTWADSPVASAAACTGNYLCCDLAHPNGPYCGGHIGTSNFSCPSGYHKTYWTCCCEECCVDCYECSKGSGSCYDGPWSCSNAVASCGGGG
jgi:hypothetical protein